ncbi:DUF2590 family protein [Microbulbifer variabilis]|uniref:DUF2590 family protein n=1 Tax=Microbulbifer variabilis TaxID=266805 RepID=A0ABY4V973_9GAMM|nr:DUF2590 family protein [Microbulbifer variabilis]USD19763.1 DUF2590 family protein [Microbulbifer variabilis]
MSDFEDLLISDDRDLTLDAGGFPVFCSGRVSIGQDIKHRILESGLALQLIGERDPRKIARIKNQILLLVDTDERIRPGTAKLTPSDASNETYWLRATTMKYGEIGVSL